MPERCAAPAAVPARGPRARTRQHAAHAHAVYEESRRPAQAGGLSRCSHVAGTHRALTHTHTHTHPNCSDTRPHKGGAARRSLQPADEPAQALGASRRCRRHASRVPAGARHSQHWRAGLRRPSESRSLRPRYVGYPRGPQRRIRAAGAGERGRPRLGWQPLTGTLPLRASSPPSLSGPRSAPSRTSPLDPCSPGRPRASRSTWRRASRCRARSSSSAAGP